MLYTSYRRVDKTIRIGFSPGLICMETVNNVGFKLIEKRSGSRREEKLLKATLEELGYKPKYEDNYYSYSKGLIKHLNMLGWPTGKKTNYQKISFNKQ